MVLLDTNICIAKLKQDKAVLKKLEGLSPGDVCLCSVVRAELLHGARYSAKVEANLKELAAFFRPMASIPFDDAAAEHYGSIRAFLRRMGTPIGANDLMIAAIALANDVTLATRDDDEFIRVPGLRVERW